MESPTQTVPVISEATQSTSTTTITEEQHISVSRTEKKMSEFFRDEVKEEEEEGEEENLAQNELVTTFAASLPPPPSSFAELLTESSSKTATLQVHSDKITHDSAVANADALTSTSISSKVIEDSNNKNSKFVPEQPISSSTTAHIPIARNITEKIFSREELPVVKTAKSSMMISSTTPIYSSNNSNTYQYKSTINQRPNVIYRRPAMQQQQKQGSSSSNAIVSRVIQNQQGVVMITSTQHKEKQQLSELNDRFATYIERVRFLEVQNKYLDREVISLRTKLGLETKEIESMYKIELEAARSILDEVTDEKANIKVRLEKTERDLDTIRKRYTDLQTQVDSDKARMKSLLDQIATNDAEIGLLKRRLNDLHDEEKRLRQETVRMTSEVQRVTVELETEINARIMLENDKQALEEQLAFIKNVHTKELDELKMQAFRDTGINPEEFFHNELANAIREIRREYEAASQAQRAELDRMYRVKVTDIKRKAGFNALTISTAGNGEAEREQTRKLRAQIHETKRSVYDMRARVSLSFSFKYFEYFS